MDLLKEYSCIVRISNNLSILLFKEIIEDINIYESLEQIHNYSRTTFKHSLNVFTLAIIIGCFEWLPKNQLKTLGIAALLHDIGKICVPKEILYKPNKLTKDEFEIMKCHVMSGCVLVESMGFSKEIVKGIAEHHERIDGSGYPEQIKGTRISREGRIIAVADVFDALTAEREYKEKINDLVVLKMMQEMKNLDMNAFHYLSKFIVCEVTS